MLDKQGRKYLRLADLPLDAVEVDAGFTCLKPGVYTLKYNPGAGHYVDCSCGRHYLAGQVIREDIVTGFYNPKE
jgi:hypothetical protein